MDFFKQIATYLYLRKPEADAAPTKFTKYMHGINRISIFIFIICMIILAVKLIRQ